MHFLFILLISLLTGGAAVQTITDPPAPKCEVMAWSPTRIPLFITHDASVRVEDWQHELDDVILWWNLQVPGVVLDMGEGDLSEPESLQVTLRIVPELQGTNVKGFEGVTTDYLENCVITRADIQILSSLPKERRRWVLAHEIGHALGLKHAPVGSLMQEQSDSGPLVLPNATIQDLRDRYPFQLDQ